MQPLLCDTSVFLALWSPNEKSLHFIFSSKLFEEARKCTYSINTLAVTAEEIYKKYSFLLESFNALCGEFNKLNKLTQFLLPSDKRGILEIKKKAKKQGFNLSFEDSAFIYAAKKKEITLTSWDKALIEFALGEGVNAFYPHELVK